MYLSGSGVPELLQEGAGMSNICCGHANKFIKSPNLSAVLDNSLRLHFPRANVDHMTLELEVWG